VENEDVEVAMLGRLDDALLSVFLRNLGLQLVFEDVNASALQKMISALDLESGG
jgi:hypothetical protein